MALLDTFHPFLMIGASIPLPLALRPQEALKKAKGGNSPPDEELYSNIWVAGENYETPVTPAYIRMPDRTKSIGNIMNDVSV